MFFSLNRASMSVGSFYFVEHAPSAQSAGGRAESRVGNKSRKRRTGIQCPGTRWGCTFPKLERGSRAIIGDVKIQLYLVAQDDRLGCELQCRRCRTHSDAQRRPPIERAT